MRLKIIVTLLLLFSGLVLAQEDPSSWPMPNSELIKNGFYNKERLERYWQWKKSTLKDLFLIYDENEIRYTKIKWQKNNFQNRFTFVNFPLEFIVDNQPTKKRDAEIKSLARSAVDTLEIIEPALFVKSMKERNVTQENICFSIENEYRNIYVLWFTSQKDKIISYKVTYCRCEFESDGQ